MFLDILTIVTEARKYLRFSDLCISRRDSFLCGDLWPISSQARKRGHLRNPKELEIQIYCSVQELSTFEPGEGSAVSALEREGAIGASRGICPENSRQIYCTRSEFMPSVN